MNEHTAQLRPAAQYPEVRSRKIGPGIHLQVGRIEDEWDSHAIRFEAGLFTPAEARRWCDEHGFRYVAFEPAPDRGEEHTVDVHFGTAIKLQDAPERTKWHLVVPERPGKVYHPSKDFVCDSTFCASLTEAWEVYTRNGEYELPVHREHKAKHGRLGHIEDVVYRPGRGVFAKVRWNAATWTEIEGEQITSLSPGLVFGARDDRGNRYDALLVEVSAVTHGHLMELPRIQEGEATLAMTFCRLRADVDEEVSMDEQKKVDAADAVDEKKTEEKTEEEKTTPEVAMEADPEEMPAWAKALADQVHALNERLNKKDDDDDDDEDEGESDSVDMQAATGSPAEEDSDVVKLRAQLEDYRRKDAERFADSMISQGKVLPAGRDKVIGLHLKDRENIVTMAAYMVGIDLSGQIGDNRPPTLISIETEADFEAAVGKRMDEKIEGGMEPRKALEEATREVKRLTKNEQ